MSDADPLLPRLAAELDDLRERSLLRTLDVTHGVNLISNDYLGLAEDPRLKAKVVEAVVAASHVGSTGSRLLSGNSAEWVDLESEFAQFARTEAALYFGSGYAANVGLLSAILRRGDVVFSDALNHASLIDGMRLSRATKVIYPHLDLAFLEKALDSHRSAGGARVIITESVFSMEGDVAPLADILRLARRYRAAVVVDEAHATGALGPQGRGIAAALGIEGDMLAVVHTCGKALAGAGAFVCGSHTMKDFLINRARSFIFSTAMPPYLACQIRGALQFARDAEDQRIHLREIAEMLRAELSAAGISVGASTTHIIPVILGTEDAALAMAAALREEGFAGRAIRPPTVPPGTSRIRLSLTARILRYDISRLARAIVRAHESVRELSSSPSVHA